MICSRGLFCPETSGLLSSYTGELHFPAYRLPVGRQGRQVRPPLPPEEDPPSEDKTPSGFLRRPETSGLLSSTTRDCVNFIDSEGFSRRFASLCS